ncbi:carbonic anhydrase [Anthocerotibacter panamensis]|uniref:carbonic anhydrase n=1 Tax=Anthocerotibacter panamensis TaxID=2857077 RepID=UPI001C403D7C|nr:carbonic anhydrase [Anthocerotibacter panamensis]
MSEHELVYLSRRDLVKFAGLGFLGSALGLGGIQPVAAVTDLSADQALERLMEGNKRFIAGKAIGVDRSLNRVQEVAKGQNPFAVLLSCADSRVPGELLFDQGFGDLFVTRVAGNFIDDNLLGSIEFAAQVLGAPLIFVLGHERCGAVQAAVSAVKEGKTFPGHLANFVEAIRPAAESVKDQPGDLVENTIKANVLRQVERLKRSQPILSKLVDAGKLKVVGGRYDLDTGEVTLFT